MRRLLICAELLFLVNIFSAYTVTYSQEITAEQLGKIRGKKVTAEEVREANNLLRKWNEYFKAMDRKKFHVKGQVVDDEGNELNDVKMYLGTYIMGTFFNPEAGKWTNREMILKDGAGERGQVLNLAIM